MSEQSKSFKSGFIGIVGPTNSGKSTLMNALMGRKISIVSPKVQTTYHGVKGILNSEDEQLILLDTPGFQKQDEPVARLLNRVAEKNAKDCDALVWVFDASNTRMMAQLLKMKEMIVGLKPKESTICVLNKVDKVAKPALLPLMQSLFELGIFSEVVPLSAKTGDGISRLSQLLRTHLPAGTPLYPKDMVTDRPNEFLISELVREKIYRATEQEIPYCAWVEIEEATAVTEEEPAPRVPTIRAVIHVDSQSRRGILIGKGGSMLKTIGTEARKEIETLLGRHICLKLHVDVQGEWKKDAHHLNRYLELQ